MAKATLIFDLDNTLVECGAYYSDAITSFVEDQFSRTGVPREVIKGIFSAIDLESTKMHRGFGKERFPRSFAAASAVLDIIRGVPVAERVSDEAWRHGNRVFDAPYEIYAGVADTLREYQNGGWQLLICSKGDLEVQSRKVRINGLRQFFPLGTVYITLVKSPEYLQKMIEEQHIDVSRSWYIGDSMRDDIGPALKVGLKAVHVRTGTGGWAYENEEHPPTASVGSVAELPTVIPLTAAGIVELTPGRERKASVVT